MQKKNQRQNQEKTAKVVEAKMFPSNAGPDITLVENLMSR